MLSLVEKILTLRGIVVSGDRYGLFICADCAWHVVLVEAVVIAEERAIADVEASSLMIDYSRGKVHAYFSEAIIRIAKERFDRNIYRSTLK